IRRQRKWFGSLCLLCLVTFAILRYVTNFEILPTHLMSTIQGNETRGDTIIKRHEIKIKTESVTDETTQELQHTIWPSLRHTNITMEEIKSKINRSREAAMRDNHCASVYNSSHQAWRSSSDAPKDTRVDDFSKIDSASRCSVFDFEELMKPAPSIHLSAWEKDYLSSPHVISPQDIASPIHSTIELITPLGINNSLVMGSEVKFKVTLFNYKKELRTEGGDQINVWITSDDPKASVAADVIDNRNGTYTVLTRLPWCGKVKVMAVIAHHREMFRMDFYTQRIFKASYLFAGSFVNDKVAEFTPCSPLPYIPGHASEELCNLTELNGEPWYCARPVKVKFLNCSHFSGTRRFNNFDNLPLSETETWLRAINRTNTPLHIASNISLNVIPDETSTETTLPLPKLRCDERNLSSTFDDTNSCGYFYKDEWRPFTCQLPPLNSSSIVQCLSKRKVIFIGDSNSRAQYESLTDLVECQQKVERTKTAWHATLLCEDERNNISISYLVHSYPFLASHGEELPIGRTVSDTRLLDSIPSNGKYIIHFHHFLHLAPYHLSVAETRLKLIRDAVRRLLDRNPHVIILYQSAHYVSGLNFWTRGGIFYVELQRRILRGLGDRVMFVFTWPMTIAADNDDFHPHIAKSFTHLFTGHICGRLFKSTP
ncbi:NXPE family member 3, partial [Biomphalaria pfeifferi]